MTTVIKIATTDAERDAIYRLRYEVYVEEMKIFGAVADHERRMLIDPNDADARLMYATVDGEIVGTLRLNLGKDAPFTREFEQTYDLERFRPAASDQPIFADGPVYAEAGRQISALLGSTNVRDVEHAATDDSAIYDVPFFDGLDASETKRVTSRGFVFDVGPDHRVIRQGQVARTVFVVLSGSLELCNEDGLCTEAHPGDVVGESAFLLATPRIADVYAGPGGAQLLSLDENRLQHLVDKRSPLAALLLLNLSKALARKLAAMRTLPPKSALGTAA